MQSVVVVGIGELGSVFARGFLRLGHPVVPVTRKQSMREIAASVPEPALCLVAVAEADLATVLRELPASWRDRAGLLQNELLPADWHEHGMAAPTVSVVWFEKKPTTLVKELLPTVVFGPRAGLVRDALDAVGIRSHAAESEDQLLFELIAKNLYILVTNLAGLETGGNVQELWEKHRALAERVGSEVLAIQEARAGKAMSRPALWARFAEAVAADPSHACTGRSAPGRLARALAQARGLGLDLPELARIANARGIS